MGVFEMVTVVVIVGCLAGVINNFIKSRQTDASLQSGPLNEALERLDSIEERIRVLEKVVTDDRYELKRQLDALEKD